MLLPDTAPPLLPAAGLPLTAFEEFMFLDDRPSHPMLIAARFDFIGGVPPPSLAAAFAAALRDEPLLTARIVTPRHGRPRWMPGPVPTLAIATEAGTASDHAAGVPPIPRLDPRSGPVLHAAVISAADGWSLVVAVHHAACDGLGLVGFVERWLVLAAGGRTPRRTDAAAAIAALRRRGGVAESWPDFVRTLPKLAKGLEGVWQFVGREVAMLGEPPPAASAAEPSRAPGPWQPAVITASLDETLVGRLRARARQQSLTTNDLLMGAFLTALGDHLDGTGDPRWIRLATPMSLRTEADAALPAANRVSMVFLDRRPADRLDPSRLLQGLRTEMNVIRGHHLGHILPLSLEVGRRCPGGLARIARRPQPQSTAVLSNLGRCFQQAGLTDADGGVRVGSSRLAGWWFSPPVRPGTALAAATHETQGRRTIAFHVDEARITLDEARQWLDRLVAALAALADGAAGPRHEIAVAVP